MLRKIICLVFCVWQGLAALACSQTAKSNPTPAGNAAETSAVSDKPVAVAVVSVTHQDLSQGLKLAAEFRPFQETDLHAKVAGYLKKINVDVGDRVQQGQVIAELEIPEFKSELAQAEASKKRSESDVTRARSEIQRAQSVYDAAKLSHSRLASVSQARPNLLAQQELDDAVAKVQVAEAQLNSAKAALAVTEEQVHVLDASVERVKVLAAYSVITAPFAGVVTKRFADLGAMIQQGTASQTQAMPLIRLSQVSHLRLVLPVPESVVPRIRLGRTVRVEVPSLNRTFQGRVSRFAEKVDTATRTMETEVDVPNPGLILKPGMYAYADLELDQKSAALVVPVQAINRAENKTRVMLVNGQNKLEMRDIVLGMETPDAVEVLSGLAKDDRVVIGNLSQLKQGQAVTPKETTLGEVVAEKAAEKRGGH